MTPPLTTKQTEKIRRSRLLDKVIKQKEDKVLNYIVYIAGPYSGDTQNNIKSAQELALYAWNLGFTVICPHLNSANFEFLTDINYINFLVGDLLIMERCANGIFFTKNWKESKGAKIEFLIAKDMKLDMFFTKADLITKKIELTK